VNYKSGCQDRKYLRHTGNHIFCFCFATSWPQWAHAFYNQPPLPNMLTIKVAGISFLIHADKLNAHDKMDSPTSILLMAQSHGTFGQAQVRRIRRRRGHLLHELMKLHGLSIPKSSHDRHSPSSATISWGTWMRAEGRSTSTNMWNGPHRSCTLVM
jgi:hypothetical protein